jgi:hypothetical protein
MNAYEIIDYPYGWWGYEAAGHEGAAFHATAAGEESS